MDRFDYIIVGGGAAGCVLAYRLSADPEIRVCLIEAGSRDTSPFIAMPKGLSKVMANRKHVWTYVSEPVACTGDRSEAWLRGRVLGGSSAINGMVYVRGMPADFDAIAEVSSDDWGWPHIASAYKALENHELGRDDTRGDRGPLRISMPRLRNALSEAQLRAGQAMGWKYKEDVNSPDDDESIGFVPCTIAGGQRQSAATAFLRPAEGRKNLTVMTDCTVDRVTFDGKRAVGVEYLRNGQSCSAKATREVLICGGAMASPAILERSGIGDAGRLAHLDIPIVHHNPRVGENLIEHRGLLMQWKLKRDISQNRNFRGWGLLRSVTQYVIARRGPMAAAAYEIGGWVRTRPELNRPDAQMLIAPFSFDFGNRQREVERFAGMHVAVYSLRPKSGGAIHICTSYPLVAARF